MKRTSEPHSERAQRVSAVVVGTFFLCLMSIGNFFRKDHAEYFAGNLLWVTLAALAWGVILFLWVLEVGYLWRQARVRLQFRSVLALLGWLLLGGAYVGGGAYVSLVGWALRLAMSDDLR